MIGEVRKKQVIKKYVQFDSNFLETVFLLLLHVYMHMHVCVCVCVGLSGKV